MELPIDDTDQALFTAATRVTVNNGKTARFWTASWIDGTSPALLFPDLYSHSKRKNRTVFEAMTNDQWVRDVSHDLTVGLISEFVQLWTLVEEAHFDPSSAAEDTITWTRTASGEYTAKSAYLMQFDGGASSLYPKTVWHVWAPSRCKIFLWLLLQNRVWTADRLLMREWPNSYFCPLCYRNLETAQHLSSECEESRRIWAEVSSWVGSPGLDPTNRNATDTLMDWFHGLAGDSSSTMATGSRSLAILVTWSIWKERNARVFNNTEKTVARLVEEIKDEARLWCQAGAKHLSRFSCESK